MLLLDINMPKNCFECPMYDNQTYICKVFDVDTDETSRPEECLLKEINNEE